ncbi:MAG: hypothetical protein R6V10_01860 [bacterium]
MISIYILIGRGIDFLLSPLVDIHPAAALIVVGMVVGIVAIINYKYTSNQDRIKDAKDKIKGHFYEVWLYIDDAAVIVGSQLRILYHAGRYLSSAFLPIAIMVVIFFSFFANFESRFASRPVRPGEDVLVKVRLSKYTDGWKDMVKLDLPQGVKMESQPLRQVRKVMESPESIKVKRFEYLFNYKLKPETAGVHELDFEVDGNSFRVPLISGEEGSYGRRVPPYATQSLGTAILYPPLTTIPSEAPVEFVEIEYPEADLPFFGWDTWWVWPFLIISLGTAFLVKGIFKVEI